MKYNFIWLVIFMCFLHIGSFNPIDNDTPTVENTPNTKTRDICTRCEEVVGSIISLRKSNASRAEMKDYMGDLCINTTDYGSIICMGWLDIKADTILYIIDHTANLTAARFCAIQFQTDGCVDPAAEAWSIPLPAVPSITATKSALKNDTSEPLLILQLTDFHYDPLYKRGSNANCKEPLCCDAETAEKAEDAAGYWGDYRVCDSPWSVIQNAFFQIKGYHKNLDWIYFTGDIVDHRTWATSIEHNSESIKKVLNMFANTFPQKKVYPILGNHESHPADFYAPDTIDKNLNISTQWIYDLAYEEWSKWLPASTEATIKKGGFYTVLVKPGVRIIALNSNVCFTPNLWLTYDDKDPYGQLQWLVDVLTESEKNGERVHILSHVPPGDLSCHRQCSHVFKKIVLRFADTIAAQFNGHTHQDEFKIFFNSSSMDTAVNVAYNGGSLTTYIGSNPNYRIYEVDNDTMMVTDYSQYTFNLTEANLDPHGGPTWHKLYSFKNSYELPDLGLESLGKLYGRMASNNSDNEHGNTYYRYMFRRSDARLNVRCDETCRKNLVCLIGATERDEAVHC